jgi:hypothetical protein
VPGTPTGPLGTTTPFLAAPGLSAQPFHHLIPEEWDWTYNQVPALEPGELYHKCDYRGKFCPNGTRATYYVHWNGPHGGKRHSLVCQQCAFYFRSQLDGFLHLRQG